MAWTWTELMDDIKVKGMIPTSQNTFTEPRLLSITNAVLLSKLMPNILKAREAYYSYDIDAEVNATGLYDIHTRAVGGKLDNVALINGSQRLDLVLYLEDEVQNTSEAPGGNPGYFIKRSQFTLLPTDGANYTTVRQTIFLRPPKIIAPSGAAQITGINQATRVLTFAAMPATWVTSNLFDMVQESPHFDTLAISRAITAITATTITFTGDLPSRLVVGDWVSLAGETPVIQVPAEFNTLLAQYAANECLKNGTDAKAYEIGLTDAKEMLEGLMGIITPRVEREGKVLVNRSGLLRRGG